MQFDWWTLGLQTINFLVLVWLLQRFLYRPVKEILARRQALAGQALADAEAAKNAAHASRAALEKDRAALADARQQASRQAHDALETERSRTLAKAQSEAAALVAAAHASIAEERERALAELRSRIADLSVELAGRLLAEAGASVTGDVFLKHLAAQLQELPEGERERLRADLARDGARLTVATAAALPPGDRTYWTEQLRTSLDQPTDVEFVVDPALIGGAELRFPHAALKLSWVDQLEKARESLAADDAAP
jgi:F-type H+-transporting ATPase subunit b